MEVQGSLAGSSAYALQLEPSTSASSLRFHKCFLGVNLEEQTRLITIDDDPNITSSYRHRFVIIGKAHGQFFESQYLSLALENDPRFPFVARPPSHPFLRGSMSFDPTTKASLQEFYLASPGWGPGGGIVHSHAAALALVDGYKRLTGSVLFRITGLSSSLPTPGMRSDFSLASSKCRRAPTVNAPRSRPYCTSWSSFIVSVSTIF